MLKSGIGTQSGHVGKHLHGHPGLAVCGIFDHPVDPWTGATQGYHSLQFLEEGMKLEVLWAPPAILSVRFPGFGRELKEHLMHFDRTAPFDVFVNAAHSQGSVKPSTFGKQPDIQFDLDQRDVDLLKRGLLLLADICWAAGSVGVLAGVHGVPDVLETKEQRKLLADHPMKGTDATIGMNHVFGTTRMGDDPKTSVVDGFGRVHGTPNLWIADTGVFAGSPAVNPMLTCMALARRTSRAMVG
jgi:choline dehydrogenase-like flavoprotein